MTGSADKDVKFWDFEVREIEAEGEGEELTTKTRVLTMSHAKTLKMTDDVLAVKYSPDGRLLAVSLLDSTVKVFYADTLKFFLSLYGHKVRHPLYQYHYTFTDTMRLNSYRSFRSTFRMIRN